MPAAPASPSPSDPPSKNKNPLQDPQPKPRCRLTPINLHDPSQFSLLKSQRLLCGWDSDDEILRAWRDEQDRGRRYLFWVVASLAKDTELDVSQDGKMETDSTSLEGEEEKEVRAGHVALAVPTPDLIPPASVVSSSTSTSTSTTPNASTVLSIHTLFIHPTHRARALGRTAIHLLQHTTLHLFPGTRYLTLTALSDRYLDPENDGPEGRGIWWRIGWEDHSVPRGSVRKWYESMGWTGWKEGVVYEVDVVNGDGKDRGEKVGLWEVFMWKDITV